MSRFLVATTGHSMPLSGGETCVGSDPAVHIPVRAEMGLMPKHFVIAPSAKGWQLVAFEGAMVMVNDRQVNRTEIHDGDQIVAGQLALIYRDEQEAAMVKAAASLSMNSFPSLHLGLPSAGEAAETSEPPPQTGYARPAHIDEVPDEKSVPRAKGGRWDHIGLMFLGGLLLTVGSLQVEKMLHAETPKPVKATDLVFIKAEIFGSAQVPREVGSVSFLEGIQGIEVVISGQKEDPRYVWTDERSPWSQVVLSGQRKDARHVRHSILGLPKDLPFDPAWQEPGNKARIGVLKTEYNYDALLRRNWDFSMTVATLEVNGQSFRSLAQLNAARAAKGDQFLLFAAPAMLLLGLFFLSLGFEKWKTLKAARR